MSPPALVGQMHPMGWEQTQPHKHDTTPDVPADRTAMPWDASRSDAPPRSPGEPPRPGGRPVHAEEVDELDALLRAVYPLIRKYEEDNAYPDDTRVIEHRGGPELRSALDLSLPPEGSRAAYVRTCEEAIRYSVRTSHPRFMNQLYAGSEPAGQVAEFLAAVLNSTVHTYGAGPVFTVMERELIAQVATLVGFDADEADGVFAPGGSYSNMTALLVARNELFPHVSRQGWQEGDRPVVYTSVQAHYSVKKAVMIAGMGSDNLIEVPTDADGAMDPAWLESHIIASKDNARRPFFVSATAGTTVLGAIDPLPALHDICQRHGVWLHVDGAWGGALIMSDTHRHKLSGLEKADSFCFNPHKLLGVPLQCSMLLVNKHSGALERANNTDADYLFHAGAGGGVDLGQKSLQCGRKPDCLKLFLCWKRFGAKGSANRLWARCRTRPEATPKAGPRGTRGSSSLSAASPRRCTGGCSWMGGCSSTSRPSLTSTCPTSSAPCSSSRA
ncbi:pyridoxal phosphate-dependent transferase [Baffinella frigidus]|nr:pyridoxal phosphate-dependent transferase [Cryptophyta sp. CCMP2293]